METEKKSWIKEAFNTKGIWSRKEFVLFQLAIIFIISVVVIISFAMYTSTGGDSFIINSIALLLFLSATIIGTYVGILSFMKRLRDLNHNPWLSLIAFVPYISFIFLLYCGIRKSATGETEEL